ncbi:MAG TPA: hypothetical protein VMB03_17430 [Bryobacteraceae bacterium]|nr:hypothetical protein [Bryobacteraceae bacterium]
MNKHTLAFWLGIATLFAPCSNAQLYIITTFAGGANPYFLAGTGDSGPATQAGLATPSYDVAVDGTGNTYIVAGTLIRRVNTAGVISTVAGGGIAVGDLVAATSAALAPTAIAVDSKGNLYIADNAFGTSRIRTIGTGGIMQTVAGGAQCCVLGDGGPANSAYIGIPWGIAVDQSGNLYIAQSDNSGDYRIRVVSGGAIATIAGGGTNTGDGIPAISAALTRVTGIAVDSTGSLFIAENGANRVRKVSAGMISTVATLDSPWHLTVDSADNLYVTQPNDATVQAVSAGGLVTPIAGSGSHGYSGDGGLATNAALDRPYGITLGSQGVLYVSDATSTEIPRVRLLTPTTVCDVNHYGMTTPADVQTIINEALGLDTAADDLNKDGVVNVVDIELVVASALGYGCQATS